MYVQELNRTIIFFCVFCINFASTLVFTMLLKKWKMCSLSNTDRKKSIGTNISKLKGSTRLESSEDPYTFLFKLITENTFQHDDNWNQRMPILKTGMASCVHEQSPVKKRPHTVFK